MSSLFIKALGILHNFLIDEREEGNPDEDDEAEMLRLYAEDLEEEKRRTRNRLKSADNNLEPEEPDDEPDENVQANGKSRLEIQIREFKKINNL